MHHIHSYQSNGWLICSDNMQFLHIGSDCRQLLWVFLGHPHPRNVALASSRELAMQDFVLLLCNFAGRFNCLQFTCRRHARYVTQVLSDCTYVCLRLSGRQSVTPWVTYLAGAGTLTAAFASVCKTLGSLCALQIAGALCLLLSSSQVCVGQTLFLVRLIWGLCSPETLRLTLGSYPCSHSLGCSFCLCYAQKSALNACFLFVGCRLNPMLLFGMDSWFLVVLCFLYLFLLWSIFYG